VPLKAWKSKSLPPALSYEIAASPPLSTVVGSKTIKKVESAENAKFDFSKKSLPSNSTKGNEFKVEEEITGLSVAEDCERSLFCPEISFQIDILPVSKMMDAESLASSQSKRLPRHTGVKEL